MTLGIFSFINGWASSKFYLVFNGSSWLNLTLIASCGYPLLFILQYILIDKSDSSLLQINGERLSFWTLVCLLFFTLFGTSIGTLHQFS